MGATRYAKGGCCVTAQDPEGILAAPKGGHIQRRFLQKQIAEDKELAEKVEQAKQVARQELLAAREVLRLASSVPLRSKHHLYDSACRGISKVEVTVMDHLILSHWAQCLNNKAAQNFNQQAHATWCWYGSDGDAVIRIGRRGNSLPATLSWSSTS